MCFSPNIIAGENALLTEHLTSQVNNGMTNKIHQNMRAGKRQSQDTSFAGQSSLRPYHGEKVFFPCPGRKCMQGWEFHPLNPLNFHPHLFYCPCSCRLRKRFMAHFLRECRTCMQTATWKKSHRLNPTRRAWDPATSPRSAFGALAACRCQRTK